jgi:hypothetical protein
MDEALEPWALREGRGGKGRGLQTAHLRREISSLPGASYMIWQGSLGFAVRAHCAETVLHPCWGCVRRRTVAGAWSGLGFRLVFGCPLLLLKLRLRLRGSGYRKLYRWSGIVEGKDTVQSTRRTRAWRRCGSGGVRGVGRACRRTAVPCCVG